MKYPIKIQVLIDKFIPEIGHNWKDAIYYTEAEFAGVTDADIDAEIDRRVAKYIDLVNNPIPPIEPTKEQLMEEKSNLEFYLQELESRILEKE